MAAYSAADIPDGAYGLEFSVPQVVALRLIFVPSFAPLSSFRAESHVLVSSRVVHVTLLRSGMDEGKKNASMHSKGHNGKSSSNIGVIVDDIIILGRQAGRPSKCGRRVCGEGLHVCMGMGRWHGAVSGFRVAINGRFFRFHIFTQSQAR